MGHQALTNGSACYPTTYTYLDSLFQPYLYV